MSWNHIRSSNKKQTKLKGAWWTDLRKIQSERNIIMSEEGGQANDLTGVLKEENLTSVTKNSRILSFL